MSEPVLFDTYCGIDVGGSSVRVGAVHPDRGLIDSLAETHSADRSPAAILAHARALVDRLYDGVSPRGVGLGVAAWLERDTGTVVSAPNLPWVNVPVARDLAATFPGLPVSVANDLKAIAWGEYRFGAGRGAKSLMVVFAGTGIGSAVVDDGRLILGAEGFAGEIGHVRSEESADARRCGCGARGCLEAYAGGRALAERSGSPALPSAEELEQWAHRDRDTRARELLEDAGTRLGRAVAAGVMLANPSVLILGGGVWDGSSLYRTAALETLRAHVHPDRWKSLSVRTATLGNVAGVVGAADRCRVGAES